MVAKTSEVEVGESSSGPPVTPAPAAPQQLVSGPMQYSPSAQHCSPAEGLKQEFPLQTMLPSPKQAAQLEPEQ